MSVTIITETDQRMKVVANAPTRLLTIGNAWTRARIGVRMHFVDTGAPIANFFFIVTLQADQNSTFRTGSPTLTCAADMAGFPANTRNAGPPVVYNFSQCNNTTKHGATQNNGTPQAWQCSADPSVLNAFFFEVTKGSPNYTMKCFHPNTLAAGQTNIPFALFYDYLLNGNMADGTGIVGWPTGYSHPPDFVFAVDEATYGDMIYSGLEYENATGGAVIADYYVAGE